LERFSYISHGRALACFPLGFVSAILSAFFAAIKMLALSLSLLAVPALAMGEGGRAGHGLIGYGIDMYKPLCAYSCRAVIGSSALDCSQVPHDMPGMDMGMDMGGEVETSPECYATDDAFLQTLAWCMSEHCKDVPAWQLEKYWVMNVAGTSAIQPDPKVSYQEALAAASKKGAPTQVVATGDALNRTSLVSQADYESNFEAQWAFENAEDTHERYG
jgi:hypothetical protein